MSERLLCHLLVFIVLTLPACTLFNPSYSEVIDQHFNPWLGKTKDDRMRVAGPPEQCAQLQSGEEVCSWKSAGVGGTSVSRWVQVSSWMHQVVFVYDKQGIAQSWKYSGTWGERSSGDPNEGGAPQSGGVLP
jgi:hypothetical protein